MQSLTIFQVYDVAIEESSSNGERLVRTPAIFPSLKEKKGAAEGSLLPFHIRGGSPIGARMLRQGRKRYIFRGEVPLTGVFGQYASCKYICWQTPFMIIGTKILDYFHLRGVRLAAEKEHCKSCSLCTIKCPMNIEVMENVKTGYMSHTECLL